MVPPKRTAQTGVPSGMNLPAHTSSSPAQFSVVVPSVSESVEERPNTPARNSDEPLNAMAESSSRLGLPNVFAQRKAPENASYCAIRMSRSPAQGRLPLSPSSVVLPLSNQPPT